MKLNFKFTGLHIFFGAYIIAHIFIEGFNNFDPPSFALGIIIIIFICEGIIANLHQIIKSNGGKNGNRARRKTRRRS